MKIAFFGDIVGKTGRKKLESSLRQYVSDEKIDFVVVNAENATAGAGLSASHAKDLLQLSVDCITLGDHAFDNKEIIYFKKTFICLYFFSCYFVNIISIIIEKFHFSTLIVGSI